MWVVAAAAPLLLPFLRPLLWCLTVSLLLARRSCQFAAAWCRATAALVAEELRDRPFQRATPEGEEQEEEDSGGNHVQCAVCLTPLRGGGEEEWRLGCGHIFHRACLDRWVGQHRSTCPLCRAYLLPPDQEAWAPSGAETIVVAPFSFSGAVGDTGKWWLR